VVACVDNTLEDLSVQAQGRLAQKSDGAVHPDGLQGTARDFQRSRRQADALQDTEADVNHKQRDSPA